MNNRQPPRLPLLFFRWFCHSDYQEDIEGDLLERFDQRVSENGSLNANTYFIKDILMLFRPGILRSMSVMSASNNFNMYQNHLKITLRYLRNHKGFASINLIGLTVGFLVSFFTMLYVDFELSYDSYHENAENIYRLVTDIKTSSGVELKSSSVPMAPAIAEVFPEVTGFTQVFLDYMIVQSSPKKYFKEDLAYVDPSFFSTFNLPLISGNSSELFTSPYDAVLSESAALKYFGSIDCLGKRLTLDGSTEVSVGGVMEDMPYNSHFRTDILISLSLLTDVWNPDRKKNWQSFGLYTYLMLQEDADVITLNKRLGTFVNNIINDDDADYKTSLEPLRTIYLHADPRGYRTGSSLSGNIQNVYVLVIVTVFVLFIAGFNFVNLSTALSLDRCKEISVRKVIGIKKGQLAFQFLIDALLISFVAFALAIFLVLLASPYFNYLAGKPIITNILDHSHHIFWLLAAALSLGLIAGLYPAFFLSGHDSVKGLKGYFATGTGGIIFKKLLVITQFLLSITLIISTIGVYQQLRFMQNSDVGYSMDKKLILDFYFDREIKKKQVLVKEELLSIPGVNKVSISSSVPGYTTRKFMIEIPDNIEDNTKLNSNLLWIDHDFLDLYEIDVIAGRSFDRDLISDIENAIILNETAVKQLGYKDPKEILGKPWQIGKNWKGVIVGVVNDFHHQSMKEVIQPLTFHLNPNVFQLTFFTLNIADQHVHETISKLEDKWELLGASRPFSYYFADQAYQAQYESEDRFGKLIFAYAIVAIFISGMGLLGLSAFSTSQRAKEIGIRKVLGASPPTLLRLLSKDFLKLIGIAFVIGIPVAVLGLNNWLENFAYHIELDVWIFLQAAVITLTVSFITIGSQVLKIAFSNPVDSLRAE